MSDYHWRRLFDFANGIRGLYGVPVYLCGSALNPENADPRDWDIRLTLSDRDFETRYGPVRDWEDEGGTGIWQRTRWRWSADCVRRSKQASSETGLNVDFQIYPRSHVAIVYADKPRVQIDTRRRVKL